jgi:hypothetical protein
MNPSPRRDFFRLSVVVWSLVIGGIAARTFVRPYAHTVYDVYAPAARLWWLGFNIYFPYNDYYRYSPLFAVLLTPFALLPDDIGAALWKIFNAGVFMFALGVLCRRVMPAHLTRQQVGLLFLLALPPALHSMYIGQANLLMWAAVMLACADAVTARWNRAAVYLAFATLVKGYPLALALILTVLYPRRFPVRFAVALSLGLVAPFATQKPEVVALQYQNWFRHMDASTVIMRERARSLDHLLDVSGYPLAPRTYALVEVMAGLATLALCWLAVRRSPSVCDSCRTIFLLFTGWVVLFGPATEACTYAVIAPALAWLLVDAFARPTSWLRRASLLAALLLTGPVVTDLFGPTVRAFAVTHGSQPLGGLLYLGCVFINSMQGARSAPAQEAPADPDALVAA